MKKDKKSKDSVSELKGQLARALADYDNLRKRADEEKDALFKYSSQRIIAGLLPILDMLEAAQKHINDQGLAIAIKEFKDLLREEGVEVIPAGQGEAFDEDTQDVIEVVEGGEHGKIKEAVLAGYRFADGHVIRHAKVKVYGGLTESKKGENMKKENKD
ncbi:MAG: heat shock protein GrpE [uncultured bacterium]|uniref:Protein GrpE n=1 Tax=Candidatus Woesebacteria bacterium RIFCSPHIGHO2_12_FULL_41_24 TaxID=1802510 RepID=A0A1F8AUN4_9BACT|nr:MAG: heat shock protein GrpE [uncultured bacterium]OGM14135.1 MAG: nucleotide exchange factor GrpE [Candidatus Woesebacteria bacterium RBG_16_41_13]OGM29621.1 MAG: nucleotide exchange factor GrpE [Candidatus Woesebacteria bacterium RIFCSPHIGHO2_01_FULL_42_80]OGM35598.1 MAG: nucleotide exchange factor GrpE [Candidatus Woesebacteria bacterium RIFCSPHIGHO2_02_FULL_42_20]OGM55209.1 MAG: nucleotide exchange factor GrpE [Candidatus Woesebacteria bacterium RIFCSPHIGHO2_12_FULL_41_24]OGM67163.1 MAG